MQLATTETRAESTMDLTSSTMKMNMNAMAYNAIIEKLYQYPLPSVIREISTNAYEANLMSRTAKPFLIQLPTALKPELIIRDFGPGLDDKEIDLYLNTIFSSSKSGDNLFPGGFGLGSKSPLALVDSFNIISNKNGKAYHCLWFKEEGRIPTPVITHILDTTEPNGISVVVPLNSAKFDKQAIRTTTMNAIREQLIGFRAHFRVVNDLSLPETSRVDITDEVFKDLDPLYEDETVAIFKYGNHGCQTKISVGNVIYPLPIGVSGLSLSTNGLNHGILVTVKVPIGKLDIPMSREMINGSDANKKLAIQYITDANNALVAEGTKVYNDFKLVSTFLKDLETVKLKYGFIPVRNNTQSVESLILSKTVLGSFVKGTHTLYIAPQFLLQTFDGHKHRPLKRDHEFLHYMTGKNISFVFVSTKTARTKDYRRFMDTIPKTSTAFIVKYDASYATTTAANTALLQQTITEIFTDYTKCMGFKYEVVDEAAITAWATANPVPKIAVAGSTVSLAGVTKNTFIGRYEEDFHSINYISIRSNTASINSQAGKLIYKQLNAAGKEIPFGPKYFTGLNKILLVRRSSDGVLPIDWSSSLNVTRQMISDAFKDFKVIYVSESFYDKAVAEFVADPTLTVYHEANKYTIKGVPLDLTNVDDYAFKQFAKATFLNEICRSVGGQYNARNTTDFLQKHFLIAANEYLRETLSNDPLVDLLVEPIVNQFMVALHTKDVFYNFGSATPSLIEDRNEVVAKTTKAILQKYLDNFLSKGYWKDSFDNFYNCRYCSRDARNKILKDNNITV